MTATLKTLTMVLLTVVIAGVLAVLCAAPAQADIWQTDGGYAMETVTCNSSEHSVTVDFNVRGEDSGVIAGSDLFPFELVEPVYVTVWEWVGGAWVRSDWHSINAYGPSSIKVDDTTGTTYWYFSYAFATRSGGWDYASEWAHGAGQAGLYSDQNGYTTLTSCNS